MATVTKTIGTNARDYSTISAWEADLDDTGIYSSGDDAVGECYNDSAFDESVTIDGGGSVGLSSITLTVPESERHDGTAGTGARIVEGASTTSEMILISPGTSSVGIITVEWLELDGNGNVDSTLLGFDEYNTGNAGDDIVIRNNLVHDGNLSNSGTKHGIGALPGGVSTALGNNQKIRCMNNIVYDVGRNAGSGSADNKGIWFDVANTSTKEVALYNNTVWNVTSHGSGDPDGIEVSDNSSNVKVKNNVVGNTNTGGSGTTEDFGSTAQGANVDAATNASEDTTAPGTGSINTVSSSDFVSVSNDSEDFHLVSGAVEVDQGTDIGTSPTGVEIDIDGRDRDAQADTWDIGADEFVSAAGAADFPFNYYYQTQGPAI